MSCVESKNVMALLLWLFYFYWMTLSILADEKEISGKVRHEEDTVKSTANNLTDIRIYFIEDGAVMSMNYEGNDVKNVANTTGATCLDFHYKEGLLFWADNNTKKIYAQQLEDNSNLPFNNNQTDIIGTAGSWEKWEPVAIAVDWVGDKLYVADAGGQKIDLFEFRKQSHAIVLSSNLDNLSDISLDPLVGYLFVVNAPKILRTNMDGRDIRSMVLAETVNGILVDVLAKRIFWCDSLSNIETVDYNGKNRISILKSDSNFKPVRLELFENRILWVDSAKQGILSMDKFEGRYDIRKIGYNSSSKAIKILHGTGQPPITSPCGNDNGRCEHMCVATPTSSGLGHTCVCNIGYRLKWDLRNCQLARDILIYSQKSSIRGKILQPLVEGITDAFLPVATTNDSVLALDFDARDKSIYYSEISQDVIYKVHRNGSSIAIVLPTHNDRVSGLAMDWVSKNLYYVDDRKGTLNVFSTRNLTYRRTLLHNLGGLRYIVVHPNRGYVFFTEKSSKISRIFSDGSNLVTLENMNLWDCRGLAVDYSADRLYFSVHGEVHHCNMDGGDVKTITRSDLWRTALYGIEIYEDSMYVMIGEEGITVKLNKLGIGKEHTLILDPHQNAISTIKVYSEGAQIVHEDHPCWHNNGDCQKFCFGLPTNNSETLTIKCGCLDGETLDKDGKTCLSDTNNEPPIHCGNNSDFLCDNQRCIPKSWICDGDNDCYDNSDEQNCVSNRTCPANKFSCDGDQCLPKNFWCDGKEDCKDKSDEKFCSHSTCGKEDFACANHRCIPAAKVCDDVDDCMDRYGSDEESELCDANPFCDPTNWECKQIQMCIKYGWKRCIRHERSCPPDRFKCPSHRCIPHAWKCNGIDDCGDGADELAENCPKITCSLDLFTCDNGRCISPVKICDGRDDCSDNSDEDERHECPTLN